MNEGFLEDFLGILKSQNDIFSSFYEKENNLRVYILKEDFENTKKTIQELDELEKAINFLENKRNHAYKELKALYNIEDNETFGLFLAKLENSEIRKDIKIEYENLKVNISSIQRLNSSIAQFIETKITLVNGLLSEIYPDNKETVYSKNGKYNNTKKGNTSSSIINYNF